MSDETERIETDPHDRHEGNHALAIGLLTGTAVGLGIGMLFAPRAGSELRHQCRTKMGSARNSAASGYHRAVDKAGHLANRGRDAYSSTRQFVSNRAHTAERYARDVAGAFGHVADALANRKPNDVRPV